MHNSVYKPLLAAGLQAFILMVTLFYIDSIALWRRNGSYTRTLGIIEKQAITEIKRPSKLLSLQKSWIMLTKERLNKTINNLPDSFTIDELIDQLIFIEKVEAGLKQSDEGKVVSNEDVKKMIDKWSE